MMTALGKHSLIDLKIKATGDTDIDAHHTVEDIAIVFGEALKQALGDKRGIRRSPTPPCRSTRHSPKPSSTFPDARTACAPESRRLRILHDWRAFSGSLVRHVMESIAMHAGICLHLHVISGRDPHHIAEAEFKAFARALRSPSNPIRASTAFPARRARCDVRRQGRFRRFRRLGEDQRRRHAFQRRGAGSGHGRLRRNPGRGSCPTERCSRAGAIRSAG